VSVADGTGGRDVLEQAAELLEDDDEDLASPLGEV